MDLPLAEKDFATELSTSTAKQEPGLVKPSQPGGPAPKLQKRGQQGAGQPVRVLPHSAGVHLNTGG